MWTVRLHHFFVITAGLDELLTKRLELAMPPTITLEEAKGFSLYMIRTVMNGRGDELIDLAKMNLFH
jgi:pyruvate dehydrogenase (quinone)